MSAVERLSAFRRVRYSTLYEDMASPFRSPHIVTSATALSGGPI